MRLEMKLASAVVLLAAPLGAYAQGGAPHIELYALGGGAAGGFFGALLACWLCKRFGSKNDSDSKR
jgi:hypothetical protein